jgi:hypothetical protein
MADNQEQYGFFQISHTGVNFGVDSPTKGNPVQTRDLNMRMSNFGALWIADAVGRSSVDYTKVKYGFEAKGEMEGAAEFGLHDLVQDAERIENPLVWDSTVKYTWNDEMFKMGMDTDAGKTLRAGADKSGSYPVRLPAFDTMDTKLVDAAGMTTADRNWPTEGWRSFGGKYDFLPYSGGGFTH